MIGTRLALCLSLLLAAVPDPARACGGFFRETSSSEVTAMSDIRVLLVRTQDRVEQYVQIAPSGRATRFAWVYPVAANPEVSEAKASPFASLEEQTRPRITIVTPHPPSGGGGWGCGAGDAKTAGTDGNGYEVPPRVTVWQSGQVGAFDYVVVSATRADDMLGWLNSNGFAVPASTSGVLDHYLGLGWVFVAMKISLAAQGASAVPSTTTIKLSYAAKELRYPLRMVSLSPASETRLELYVVAEDGVVPTQPWGEAVIGSALRATSSTTHNYDQVFAAALAANGGRTLVREFSARTWDPGAAGLELPALAYRHLTRFRTVLKPALLDQDLVFLAGGGSYVWPRYELTFVESKPSGLPLPVVVVALVVAGGLARRRSRGFDRVLERELKRLARARGVSLNQAALELMRRGLGLSPAGAPPRIGSALDRFVGTLSHEDAAALREAVAKFEEIDPASSPTCSSCP
jgi:hypothetical protein